MAKKARSAKWIIPCSFKAAMMSRLVKSMLKQSLVFATVDIKNNNNNRNNKIKK